MIGNAESGADRWSGLSLKMGTQMAGKEAFQDWIPTLALDDPKSTITFMYITFLSNFVYESQKYISTYIHVVDNGWHSRCLILKSSQYLNQTPPETFYIRILAYPYRHPSLSLRSVFPSVALYSPLLIPSTSKVTSYLLNPISGRRNRTGFPISSILICSVQIDGCMAISSPHVIANPIQRHALPTIGR